MIKNTQDLLHKGRIFMMMMSPEWVIEAHCGSLKIALPNEFKQHKNKKKMDEKLCNKISESYE